MKSLRPIFIENSRMPVVLSKLAPIEMWTISLGLWVWCRGELSEKTKRNKSIHFQQQLELAFAGHWILYILSYLYHFVRLRDPREASYHICFEREAHKNDSKKDYLEKRKRYAWVKYIGRKYDYKERIKRTRRKRTSNRT